jgi:hypothetical protein
MRRRPDEDLLEYLFRFNLAAVDAAIPFRKGEAKADECRAHVLRFM